jgi:hypothetical protein
MGIIVWVNQTKRNANKQAGMNIVAAFQPELDALLQTDVDSGVILSDNAYRKHESAINNNIRHLHWHQKIRLKKSWEALTCHKLDNEKKMFSYLMYSDCGSLDKRRRMRPLAIERIKEIISIVS